MTKVFSIWRFVIALSWAKTLLWSTIHEKEQRTYFLSLHTIKRDNNRGVNLIIGPISIIVGFA